MPQMAPQLGPRQQWQQGRAAGTPVDAHSGARPLPVLPDCPDESTCDPGATASQDGSRPPPERRGASGDVLMYDEGDAASASEDGATGAQQAPAPPAVRGALESGGKGRPLGGATSGEQQGGAASGGALAQVPELAACKGSALRGVPHGAALLRSATAAKPQARGRRPLGGGSRWAGAGGKENQDGLIVAGGTGANNDVYAGQQDPRLQAALAAAAAAGGGVMRRALGIFSAGPGSGHQQRGALPPAAGAAASAGAAVGGAPASPYYSLGRRSGGASGMR